MSSPAHASALYRPHAHGCRVCERTDVEDAPPDTASSRLAPFASVQRVRSADLILDATSEVKHSLCNSKTDDMRSVSEAPLCESLRSR